MRYKMTMDITYKSLKVVVDRKARSQNRVPPSETEIDETVSKKVIFILSTPKLCK